MTANDKDSMTEETAIERRHRHSGLAPIGDQGRLRGLRFWLNVLFMLAAVAGMALWFTRSHDVATYLLIAAVVLKFVEVTLRMLKL